MANPKNRTSRTRKRLRRANWKMTLPAIGKCPQCHEPKLPHHVCGNCGYYKGQEVIPQTAAKKG